MFCNRRTFLKSVSPVFLPRAHVPPCYQCRRGGAGRLCRGLHGQGYVYFYSVSIVSTIVLVQVLEVGCGRGGDPGLAHSCTHAPYMHSTRQPMRLQLARWRLRLGFRMPLASSARTCWLIMLPLLSRGPARCVCVRMCCTFTPWGSANASYSEHHVCVQAQYAFDLNSAFLYGRFRTQCDGAGPCHPRCPWPPPHAPT